MPIYEYECVTCGRIEEAIQKFSDKPLTTCKHCSGKLHKLVSKNSFHLKGTGWYVTDYANQAKKNASSPAKHEADASPKSEKNASAGKPKDESKTAKKAAD